ncbi:MAG: hydantoinase/oxoprolinase family protein [Candidatus Tectomicrobia bacterium]|nr:hydantoinase/oxoprolinase family protein [Candidatus Tectomicrobia bacterium]
MGIDIGGTFTDVILMGEGGEIAAAHKVDTTPSRLEACFIASLCRVAEGLPRGAVERILHATTVATNTVLESKGARTALVVTEGFRDILEIARQRRPSLYDLKAEKAKPLIPRRLCFEVRERMTWDGQVVVPLTDGELSRLAAGLSSAKAESVVISLLFSFVNPTHERRIKEHLERTLPGRHIVASSDVTPEFREFERTSTAALVGYLKPIFARYTDNLTSELSRLGENPEKLFIMNSAGGLMSPGSARERPHALIESGPAAGVIAATVLAREIREPNVISFDMGGTTAKASLIEGGMYRTTTDYEVGRGMHQSLAVRFTGYPVKTPVIDLTECGAGGGSIASVDAAGMLKVGPGSAGAVPGPVCYGRGGEEPTVTDANLVLGRLNPSYFVGGESSLDPDRARAAIEAKIAKPLHLTAPEAAAGIIEVVNAHMVRTLRVISVARGHDPRQFALIAFGGAGPLHAADLALDLRIPRIIIPETPGLFSALGLLRADLRADFTATARLSLNAESAEALAGLLARMEGEADAWLRRENVPRESRFLLRSGDMRYPLQNYELNVPLPTGRVNASWLVRACGQFHGAHERHYSYCDRRERVQLVTLRVSAVGRTAKIQSPRIPAGGRSPRQAIKGERRVHFQETGDFLPSPIYERALLRAGNRLEGPAVVEQADSTILIPPSFFAEVDARGRLILTLKRGTKKKTEVIRTAK